MNDDIKKLNKPGMWIKIKTNDEAGVLGIKYQELQCSNCGYAHSLLIPRNFCPNCGAYMRVEDMVGGV